MAKKVIYEFQRAGDGIDDTWIVNVEGWRPSLAIGTVTIKSSNLTETVFDVWAHGSDAVVKRASDLLHDNEMWAQLVVARDAYFAKEQAEGEFTVTVGGVEVTRWHTFQRANAYAQERLDVIWQRGLRVVRRAEISREGVGTFHAIEVNPYGHAKVSPIQRLTDSSGTWRLTPGSGAL